MKTDATGPGPAALRRPVRRALAAGALLLALSGCATFSRIERDIDEDAARRYARTGDLHAEIEDLVQPLIERRATPGLVVGVLRPDGSLASFGFGTIRAGDPRRPDGDTLFALGSTSKGFLAALTALLVEEGRVSWDRTLAETLPEHDGLSPDAGRITLEELATHTSGLPRQPFSLRGIFRAIRYLHTGNDFYRHLDHDHLLRYLRRFRAPSEPGVRYSNIGFGILGYALEQETGRDLDALMREKILDPLGLRATGYAPEQLSGHADRARGHAGDQPRFVRRGRPVPEWRYTDIMLGSAGLYSTANDLLAFTRAHLHAGDATALERALRDTLRVRVGDADPPRSLAWAVDRTNGHEIIHQIGFSGGFSAYIGMDPLNRSAVVVLQNSLNWEEAVGHRLLLRMARAAALNRARHRDAPDAADHRTP